MKIIIPLLCIIVVFVLAYLRTPSGKGWLGEMQVKIILGRTRQGEKYVLNNFIFICDGKSVQIDHIVINKNGVFVIETKNYSGRIYGSDEQRHWTQVLAGGKVKNKISNPVNQNASHIYKLGKILNNQIFMTSLVVFVQNNTQFVSSDTVIPIHILRKKLALPSKIKPYTKTEITDIYEQLQTIRSTTVTAKEHIQQINDTRELIEHNICPYCGKTLVTRHGKYGSFLGCSGYPECKYIKK